MFATRLIPRIPVHSIRLWDSQTRWCQLDTGSRPHEYDFARLYALLAQASRLRADVEFTFGGTPRWAAAGSYPQPSRVDQCANDAIALPPVNESYWTKFVTALVTHAKGRIHAYELWNEANSGYYWAGGLAAMARMSVDAASIIHRIDPSALVLSPSISNDHGGYAFLRRYLRLLPRGTIDAIAVHSYTNGAWPENAVPSQMKAVRSALPGADARIPIWSTEGGWGQNSQFSSSASDQRAFVARYDLQMLVHHLARSYWYGYGNSQWGTLWNGTALTPAGVASRTVQAWLVGATLGGCATADGNLWTCNLTTGPGRKAKIVWVTKRPLHGYSTTGYKTLETLDGRSSPAGSAPITLTTEPVLLSS
jgi:hypothetical protein